MQTSISPSRRQFLAGSAAAGLVIAFHLPGAGRAKAAAGDTFVPNAFLRIAPDSTVTVISKHIEFGQGPYTGLATILADEIDADWSQIRVESAPADVERYANLKFGAQGTGGSTAMANSWDQLRTAGAEARARLVTAAAEMWNVAPDTISIEKGIVKSASGKEATFGALAARAQAVTLKADPKPKDPSQWRLIGKGVSRVDTVPKTNGTAEFTIDIKLPNMATCLIARPDRFGAKVKDFDASEALAVPGVIEAFVVPQGVAVLAKGFWAAKKGRDALKITWDDTGTEARSSSELIGRFKEIAKEPGTVARSEGDVAAGFEKAKTVVEATYTFPYLAHAPMEPEDCVIRRTDDGGAELLFGSQLQTVDHNVAAAVLGLDLAKVKIKTMLAGGSFGRRATPTGDMAAEAASVLKAAKHDGPIKIIWTREDDIKGGRYRPIMVHHVKAGLDGDGNIVAWDQVIVGQSFIKGTPWEQNLMKDGVDHTMVEGASSLPYAIPNLRVSAHIVEVGVPTLWWRSVGSTHTAYATEAFLDQLAEAAGSEPLAIRRKLLAKEPRYLAVLNRAAEAAKWGEPVSEGRARGLAVHKSFGSYVAHVVDVSVGADGLPKVERVVCAADCGIAINPDVIRAQLEGGMGYGLSAALYGAIDMENGRIPQANFDDYRVLRINEMPDIEVHIVSSNEDPTGIGEPGVPTIAPAVANAWAKLTGQRLFALPFSRAMGKA